VQTKARRCTWWWSTKRENSVRCLAPPNGDLWAGWRVGKYDVIRGRRERWQEEAEEEEEEEENRARRRRMRRRRRRRRGR